MAKADSGQGEELRTENRNKRSGLSPNTQSSIFKKKSAVHGGLDFGDGLGDGLAEDAAAVGRDKDVVLDAYAAEVLPFFEFVEVDIVFVGALLTPLVDKGRDKVASGFVGDDEAGLQAAATTEAAEAELVAGACLIVVAHVDLAVVFHVVDVEAHHVAEAVGHEEAVGAVGHDVVEVAAEYA